MLHVSEAPTGKASPGRLKAIGCAAGALLASTFLCGFSVTPVVLDLDSGGTRSAGRVTITNALTTPLPVEVQITEVLMGSDGKAMQRVADPADIIVLPPQDLLAPGRNRVVTFQYVGDQDIPKSRYFEFSVDQVPVSVEDTGQAAIQIVYSIGGIMTVGPVGGTSDVSVAGAARATLDDGRTVARLQMRNAGKRHDFLNRGTLTLTGTDANGRQIWRQALRPEQIQQTLGAVPLPAEATREIDVPVEIPAEVVSISATLVGLSGTSARGRRP